MELIKQFPSFTFQVAPEKGYFYWRPQELTIYYSPERLETDLGKFLLLHEVGHALLHQKSPRDADYYQTERDAWDIARVLADKLGIKRQEAFIAKSLRAFREAGY